MSKVDIITSPSGDKLAVVPMAEYERLVAAAEDAEDVRLADRVRQRLASGEEELIPSAFAKRLVAGESPVRVWREYRGVSGKDLAAKAGVSAPFLSQIETGAREGSVGLIKKIAEALGVTIDDLV
ncbi:helix-turn-helix transcriptional regulator [Methylocapsa sp. S129]|uniref:helix-turn-helix domain-containing protein n=1 Tax=Methylocapsa sp. S129 TaxID=1641869 RepID=UPI00131C8472